MVAWVLLMAFVSVSLGQEVRIHGEAVVAGDSYDAEVEAVHRALRAVLDTAVVSVVGPDLPIQFSREVEARVHARRLAFVKSFSVPWIGPDEDTPYDGKTLRRVIARVRMAALRDTLVAMGLAWREGGEVKPCQTVDMVFRGMGVEEAQRCVEGLRRGQVLTKVWPVGRQGGVSRFRCLVAGDVWALARAAERVAPPGRSVRVSSSHEVEIGGEGEWQAHGVCPVEVIGVSFDEVFPASHARYRSNPVGRLVLANRGHSPVPVEVSVSCPLLLDVDIHLDLGTLGPGERREFPLVVPFQSHKLLGVVTETQALASVTVSCHGVQATCVTVPITVHARNAIDWSDVRSVCAFVTPEAGAIHQTTRFAASATLPDDPDLSPQLSLALRVSQALAAMRMRYVPDPPPAAGEYDRVQFPSETLNLRAGDCEDMAVLLASCLENGDVPTQLLLTADHVFIAFCTGLFEKDGFLVSPERERYLVRDDMVWIPVEATVLDRGFMEAWDEAVRIYQSLARSGDYVEQVVVRRGWELYPPATVDTPSPRPSTPDELANLSWGSRWSDEVRSLEEALRSQVEQGGAPVVARLVVLLARTGRVAEAMDLLQRIPAEGQWGTWVKITRGNCHLLSSRLDSAVVCYQEAIQRDPGDPVGWVNLAVAFQMGGDEAGAAEALATALDCLQGNEEALGRLLGLPLRPAVGKASRTVLTEAEVRALMERARAAHARGKGASAQVALHKFAGRKALDPQATHKAQRLVYWPEPRA